MDIPIIYEDADVLAVNKPAGVMVHSDGRTTERTLADWIRGHYPALVSVGEPLRIGANVIDRPGIVHRIDQETSGVLIVAKTQEAFQWLKEQFQAREVEKHYHAFVYGEPKEREGTIAMPIGRSKKDFRLRAAGAATRGMLREAETFYSVLRTNHAFSYLDASPKTGRTHQLRVHFKAIQHPVVCDRLYAPARPCELGFTRLALHAKTLALLLPSGVRIVLEAPLPGDFERALVALK